jgi:signal transduction histidine kinase
MAVGDQAGSRLDDLEQLAGAGTWSLEVASRAPAWSGGQHRLYGTAVGAVGSTDDWAELVHPDDRDLWRSALDATIERGVGYALDHRIVRADDGAVRWLRCRARLDGGRLHGVSLDTTDDHDASDTMRTFIADAAHELRTPAAAIGQAVSALDVVDDGQRDQVLAVLQRQAARLRALTTDLVDLARLDAGPVVLVLESVPLAAAVDEAVQHAPPPADRTVTTDVPPDLAVVATPGHLDRVLVNLLTNAYRYGGPNVVVRARPDGARVFVEVADDGPGVPDEAVEGLFRAFRRGPQRHPEASGLGLAIVARLVHRFGGDVRYRAGDPGAVFVLELSLGDGSDRH